MNNIDKILKKIEIQQLKPIPKWKFQLKYLLFWFAFVISIFIGSISFSIILYSIQQTEFELLLHLKHSRLESFMVLLPYFWLILLIVFFVTAFFSFKNFKKSYKYSLMSILGLNVFLSIALGAILFISGGGRWIENSFSKNVTFYKSIDEKKIQHWMNPEEGLLAGEITLVKDDTIEIRDFNSKKWQVVFHDVNISPVLELIEGEKIKIVGEKITDSTFEAKDLRPWKGFQNRGKNRGGNKNHK